MVVVHRPDLAESGTGVGHAGYGHAETGLQIDIEGTEDDGSGTDQYQVDDNEEHRHVDRMVFLNHAVHLYTDDCIGVLSLDHHGLDRLEREEHPVAFDTSGGRSGTGALNGKKHQQYDG